MGRRAPRRLRVPALAAACGAEHRPATAAAPWLEETGLALDPDGFIETDEFLRSQHGNNNAWCQDNDVSWIDWDLSKANGEMLRFTRSLIAFRKRHPALRRRPYQLPQPQGQSYTGDYARARDDSGFSAASIWDQL